MDKSLPSLPPTKQHRAAAAEIYANGRPPDHLVAAMNGGGGAGSPSTTTSRKQPSSSQANTVVAERDDDQWTSSSSGESSSANVQRKVVRREFKVGSPRSPAKRSSNTSINGTGSGGYAVGSAWREGSSSPRKRKNSNLTQLLSSPPPSSTSSSRVGSYRAALSLSAGPSTVNTRERDVSRRTTRRKQKHWKASVLQALRPLWLLVGLVARLLGIALSPITSALTTFVLLLLILFTAYLLLRGPIKNFLASLLPGPALSLLALPFSFLPPFRSTAVGDIYCSYIGVGCPPEEIPIGRLARTISEQAVQAHDIFQSVVALGRPDSLQLHHTEVWELAVAVRATSELDNKERLGSMLKELGDMTRDVKDSMTSLNAKGINAFTWIMHEFTRIEKTIELIQSKSGRYQVEDVSRQLDGLFQHIARDLSSLVNDIEVAIPLAKRASELGEIVMFDLSTEHARLNRAKEDTPLWRRLKDMNSFAAKQLRRDLRLCQDSVVSLSNTRRGLEEARGFLVGYRDQVSYFKASAVGFHMADHGLDPEDEVETLRHIMRNFQLAVQEAKTITGRGPSPLDDLD